MVAMEEGDEESFTVVLQVREFDGDRHRAGVERVEGACEVGPSCGKLCLFTDLLGDPLCRVRHSPAYLMLVRACAPTVPERIAQLSSWTNHSVLP